MGGMLLMCQNTTMRVYGARIKRYYVSCSKHIVVRVLVITSRWFATSRPYLWDWSIAKPGKSAVQCPTGPEMLPDKTTESVLCLVWILSITKLFVCGNVFFLTAIFQSKSKFIPQALSQIAKFMGPTWGPPGFCRPQVGPILDPWTLLSWILWTMWVWLCKIHRIMASLVVLFSLQSIHFYFFLCVKQSLCRYEYEGTKTWDDPRWVFFCFICNTQYMYGILLSRVTPPMTGWADCNFFFNGEITQQTCSKRVP